MPIETFGANTTDDYAGLEDTFIGSISPTTNFNSNQDVGVSKYATGDHAHALVRFTGLSNLPSGIVVNEARLYGAGLFLGLTAGYTITAYRILRNVNFSQTTWNIYSTGNSWQTAGAAGALDRSSSIGTYVFDGTEAADEIIYVTGVGLAQVVEDYANGVISDLVILMERTDGQDDEEYFAYIGQEETGKDGLYFSLYVDYELESGGTVHDVVATDTIAVPDSFISSVHRYRNNIDLTEITEGPTIQSKINQSITESDTTVSDTSANFHVRGRVTDDLLDVNDSFIKLLLFTKDLTEVLVMTEGPTISTTVYDALITDSIELVDEYLRRMIRNRASDETVIIIDSYLASAAGQQIISIIADDLISMSSTVFYNLYRNREGQDITTIFDQDQMTTLRSVMTSSAVELLDEVVMQFIRVVVAADAFNVIDSITALFVGTSILDNSKIVLGANQPNIVLGGYVVL